MMSQRRVRGILWQGWFFSLPETLLSWFKQVGNSSYKWRKADRRKITEGKKNEVVIWQAKRNGGRYCKKIKPSLQCVEVSKLKYIFLKCSLQHVLLSHRKRGKKVKVKNWIWPRLPQTQNVTSTIFKKERTSTHFNYFLWTSIMDCSLIFDNHFHTYSCTLSNLSGQDLYSNIDQTRSYFAKNALMQGSNTDSVAD